MAPVAVDDAPSRFGRLSYRIESHAAQGWIEASIKPPTRDMPKHVILRLRHPQGKPMHAVQVDGKPHHEFDPQRECVRLKPSDRAVHVRAVYE